MHALDFSVVHAQSCMADLNIEILVDEACEFGLEMAMRIDEKNRLN